MPAGLAGCLAGAVGAVLTGDEIRRAARRTLEPAPADAAARDIATAARGGRALLPIVARARQAARQGR